jgi:hypothetical protein
MRYAHEINELILHFFLLSNNSSIILQEQGSDPGAASDM